MWRCIDQDCLPGGVGWLRKGLWEGAHGISKEDGYGVFGVAGEQLGADPL